MIPRRAVRPGLARLPRATPLPLALACLVGCASPNADRLPPPDDPGGQDAGGHPAGGAGGDAATLDGGGAGGAGGMAGMAGTGGMGPIDAGPAPGCMPNPNPEDEVCPEICPEQCNNRDDDCDLHIDEEEAAADCQVPNALATCNRGECLLVSCTSGFLDCDDELSTGCEAPIGGVEHCSGCHDSCEFENAMAECFEGTCLPTGCVDGFADCDSTPDSCETATTTLTDCGTCGFACGNLPHASPSCASGACGVDACIGNFGDCNLVGSDGCELELTSSADCGACGAPCDFMGSTSSCASGQCVAVGCDTGYADCDGDASNGCESLASALHCGACGSVCDEAMLEHAASASCSAGGACTLGCEPGHGNCDVNTGNGCETPLTSNVHCTACNQPCAIANALGDCSTGSCEFVQCQPGWGDCNTNIDDGCETNLNTSAAHCGGCGDGCPANRMYCNGGSCSGVVCTLPQTDCDENDGTDCETDLASVTSCGACGNACTFTSGVTPHGALACNPIDPTTWSCGVSCAANYADCDGNYKNGCEIDLRSLTNCGSCGAGCAIANATATCADLTCKVQTCNPDWGDCDPNPDTCETPLNTTSACGACGATCDLPNATETCAGVAGARLCEVSQCSDAFHKNCDTLDANGCEVDTQSDAANCGACGTSCLAQPHVSGASCASSACSITSCQAGWGDCTAAAGCETAINTVLNCGACGNDCDAALPHTALLSCSGGTSCAVGTCDPGWGDCSAAPGCETNTNDVANCGGCSGTPASEACTGLPNVASSVCPAGNCVISLCDFGFADCDANPATGCERNTLLLGPCCNALLDSDLDGSNDCADECPTDASTTRRGDCGCPSAPLAPGTGCNDGACELDTACNGAGRCGDQDDCAPDLGCTYASYANMSGAGYWVCPTSRPYPQAEAICGSFTGSTLVRIDDLAENNFVQGRIGAASWLGGDDRSVEGAFRWQQGGDQFWQGTASGSPVSGRFTRWLAGEPNALTGEDCVEMQTSGFWNDRPCNVDRPFVCEVPADLCPASPKRAPGVCGCALSDGDGDGDGTPDCVDGCPLDAGVQNPGSCGCPSSPVAGGSLCSDGFCAANTQCDGEGSCGSPFECFRDSPTLATGVSHACTVTATGEVYCWGTNSQGQLGDGTTTERWGPVRVAGLSDAVQVSAGDGFSCALRADGVVLCWGDGASGRLGNGGTADQSAPVAVSNLTDAVQISAGSAHACAVRANATAACWGNGGSGRLGNNATADQVTPVAVSNLTDALQISAGGDFSCAVRQGGGVVCWGDGTSGRLGNNSIPDQLVPGPVSNLTDAVQVSASDAHACAVRTGGTAVCWGYGASGRLGDGSTADNTVPGPVSTLTGVVQIEAGNSHTCAVVDSGAAREAFCWGYGANGQIGNSLTAQQNTPVKVSTLSNVARVSAGEYYSCAQSLLGIVSCWGYASSSRVGTGAQGDLSTPTRVGFGLRAAAQVEVGESFSCGLNQDGRVACWGYNANANLGDGTLTDRRTPRLNAVAGGAQLSAGSDHACVVTGAGALYCWGRNANGQLGNGTLTRQDTPAAIPFFAAIDLDQVSGGWAHTCARTAAGKAYCWGYNANGRLGDGTLTQRTQPVAVSGLNDAASLGAGAHHTCAVRATGQVVCWGDGANGRLGNNAIANQLTPVTVIGIADAVQVDSGDYFSCAVRSGGGVKCWGYNAAGRLGDGTVTERRTATDVVGIDDALQVSTGWGHSCVVRSNGRVACWGYNANGRLGDGTTAERRTPVSVVGIDDAVSVSCGLHHSCVSRASGSIVCFGYGAQGQLGDGWVSESLVPGEVSGLPEL